MLTVVYVNEQGKVQLGLKKRKVASREITAGGKLSYLKTTRISIWKMF